MPRIINKRKSRFVILDRELMADKRIKSNHKILYGLLCSLSESCNDVFPSYKWLADQIGYETDGKTERALGMFMARNIEPLIELGMVKTVERIGYANDYEIFDYTPAQKCSESPHKNVRTTPHIFVQPLLIEKEEEEKEEVSITKPAPLETKNEVQTYKALDQDNFENPIYKNQDQLDELLQEFTKLEYQNGLYNLPGFEFDKFELRAIWRDFEGWCRTKNINENISLKLLKWIRTTKNITEPTPNFPPPPIQTKEELEAYDINELLKLRPIIKKTATYA